MRSPCCAPCAWTSSPATGVDLRARLRRHHRDRRSRDYDRARSRSSRRRASLRVARGLRPGSAPLRRRLHRRGHVSQGWLPFLAKVPGFRKERVELVWPLPGQDELDEGRLPRTVRTDDEVQSTHSAVVDPSGWRRTMRPSSSITMVVTPRAARRSAKDVSFAAARSTHRLRHWGAAGWSRIPSHTSLSCHRAAHFVGMPLAVSGGRSGAHGAAVRAAGR